MTTISLSPRLVTLINVFTVEPAHQQQLLELLARATEPLYAMRQAFSQAACIVVLMARRSRCTRNGAVARTIKTSVKEGQSQCERPLRGGLARG
jgi:hypothetical protein